MSDAVFQSLSHVWLFETPLIAARQDPLSFTISQELAQTHVHCIGYAIQPPHNGIKMFSYYQMFQTCVSFISPYTVFFYL